MYMYMYVCTCWNLKRYRLSNLMVLQYCGSFVLFFFFFLVSLKDEWNEGFPRFGVVLKDLEVEPKRQVNINIIKVNS